METFITELSSAIRNCPEANVRSTAPDEAAAEGADGDGAVCILEVSCRSGEVTSDPGVRDATRLGGSVPVDGPVRTSEPG
jgi:hypothetical protein